MFITSSLQQGSEAWLNIRKGRATASEFKKIMTPKGALSKSRIKYIRRLVRETICDDPLAFMGNNATEWGQSMEGEARQVFQDITGLKVEEYGFCQRADGAPIGGSPDGLGLHGEFGAVEILTFHDANGDVTEVERSSYTKHLDDFGLEIKCLQVDNHCNALIEGVLPDDYKLQVHGSMAVTGLNQWYFMSYFPDLEPLIIKVERDEFTEKVSQALDAFVVEYVTQLPSILQAIQPKSRKEVA